jgi:hypothetical protein
MLISIKGLMLSGSDTVIKSDIAVVERYRPRSNQTFPWADRAIDCGIRICARHESNDIIINTDRLAASTLVLPIESHDGDSLLVSLSCDTEGPEPEFWLSLEEGDLVEDMWRDQEREFDSDVQERQDV